MCASEQLAGCMGRLTRIQTTLDSNQLAISITALMLSSNTSSSKKAAAITLNFKTNPNGCTSPHQDLLSLTHPFTSFSNSSQTSRQNRPTYILSYTFSTCPIEPLRIQHVRISNAGPGTGYPHWVGRGFLPDKEEGRKEERKKDRKKQRKPVCQLTA